MGGGDGQFVDYYTGYSVKTRRHFQKDRFALRRLSRIRIVYLRYAKLTSIHQRLYLGLDFDLLHLWKFRTVYVSEVKYC